MHRKKQDWISPIWNDTTGNHDMLPAVQLVKIGKSASSCWPYQHRLPFPWEAPSLLSPTATVSIRNRTHVEMTTAWITRLSSEFCEASAEAILPIQGSSTGKLNVSDCWNAIWDSDAVSGYSYRLRARIRLSQPQTSFYISMTYPELAILLFHIRRVSDLTSRHTQRTYHGCRY